MKSLPFIIVKKFFLVSLTILLVFISLSYSWIKQSHIKEAKKSLKSNIELLSINFENVKDYNRFVKNIKNTIRVRVSIISKDGIVLADSDINYDKDKNLLDKEEILSAGINNIGYSVRFSKPLNKDMLFVAKKVYVLDDYVYIRLADDLDAISELFKNFLIKIIGVTIIFLIVVTYIVYKISQNISSETKKILRYLEDLKKQTKHYNINSSLSKEFEDITRLLSEVSYELMEKNRKKTKYTARLKLANKQKDEIISAISHEFKNPIAVIKGYSQTIIEDKNIIELIKMKFLKKVYDNANRLANMIDRLRLAIKLEGENFILEKKEIYMYSVIQTIKQDVLQTYCNRDIKINKIEDCIINGDETLLIVAIKNLIENGLKYSEDDVVVDIYHDKLVIKDNGIGIKDDDIKKITEKFYRVSKNRWNNSLGLGLSIVTNILKFHDFKLEIQSVYGEGSEFSIYF